ncbi:MFS transporter [Poseidonibacter antarcticus]|uniref:MFS transporter n=1 Tax=Poseidonibacter antarcticus TaxID=2478538 RepID=UPI000EF53721|nr:MFS transporter [Poseidonibacter antarcticus]
MLSRLFIEGSVKSVIGLGTTMTIGYGTLYYSITIMSEELSKQFNWTNSFIFGVLSVGILLGGFLVPIIGKLLDKKGARIIMSIGSILCGMGLLLLSLITSKLEFILAMLFLESVSILVLYEAAFVAFSQLVGTKAKLPIIQITLIAGFASTIFWPLISYLLTLVSWREVYQILALFHFFLALPIHYFVLKKNLKIDNKNFDEKSFEECIYQEGSNKKRSILLVSIAFSLIAIPITAMQTQFLSLFKSFGIEASVAIALGTLIGPAQVFSRILLMSFSSKATPLLTASISISMMAIGLLCLLFSGYNLNAALYFVILYGAGQGLSDIVRGTLPLYLFGKEGFGKTMGKINHVRLIVMSMVPFTFALMLETLGGTFSTIFLSIVTVIAVFLIKLIDIGKTEKEKR